MTTQFTIPERGPICFPELEVYDASALAAFERCPFAYNMRYNRRVVSDQASAVPLTWGGAIHEALAFLLTHEWDVAGAVQEYWKYPGIGDATDKHRTPEKGEALVRAYKERWAGNKDYKTLTGEDGKPMVEVAFVLPLDLDVNITLAGRIDCGVEHGGIEYVLDHKTTGSMYFLMNDLRPQLQFDIYSWAFRTLRERCGGIIVDIMDVGKKGGFELARVVSPRSTWEMDQVPVQAANHARHIQLCKSLDVWPTYRTHCFRYNRQCDYANCCMHNVEVGLKEVREGGEE